MKKTYYKFSKRLFISLAVLFITLHTSFVSAERFKRPSLNRYVETRSQAPLNLYRQHNNGARANLPEGAFICNGKVVIAPAVIRRQLSCAEKKVKRHHLAQF